MPIPEEQKIKLESMQIKGIRSMIWQNIEKENIESRLLQKAKLYKRSSKISKFAKQSCFN